MENKIIEALRREAKPLLAETLLEQFEEKDEAAAAIAKLLASGRLMLTRKRKIALPEQTGLIYGRIQGNSRGYGFFVPEDGSADMFIPAESMRGAMHGDKAWARQTEQMSHNGSPECEIVLIAVRAQSRIVGTFESERGGIGGYVIPDDTKQYLDVLIPASDVDGAKNGDKVVAQITQYPDGRRPLTGSVIEVLGNKNDVGTDILSVIRRMDLPEEFPKTALKQARALNKPVDKDVIAMREDLRGLKIITIDGADAKDLDDAVSLTKLKNGYLLGVHIADVSHYVIEGSLLDEEAYKRGTSVYFPDRVLPMLPPDISNGVCSLNEGTEKLTLSCFMEISKQGKIVSHRLAKSVIKTCHRMTYDSVNAMFAGDENELKKYRDVAPMLNDMRELMAALNAQRVKRGSIDFDLDEPKITLDSKGHATDISIEERGEANRMIEEFMLAANETVAQHARDMDMPFVYRVHETPDKDKLAELNVFLTSLGFGIKNLTSVRPKTIQGILERAKGTREENVISRVTLRSLKKARYAPECLGHFGLAADSYCHFTSPIRRYPDLMVHRMLKLIMDGGMTKERVDELKLKLDGKCKHCSEREVAAVEAERAADELKKCEYMQSRVGTIDIGVISGVAQYGFFVQLSNTVEGMVRAGSIEGDYYVYDQKNYRMTGRGSGRTYRLGDEVRVKVKSVDMESSKIDFELVRSKEKSEKQGEDQSRRTAKPNEAKPGDKKSKRTAKPNEAKPGDKKDDGKPEKPQQRRRRASGSKKSAKTGAVAKTPAK